MTARREEQRRIVNVRGVMRKMYWVFLVASGFLAPIIVTFLLGGSRGDFSFRFVCVRVGNWISFPCSMHCISFPVLHRTKYVGEEKNPLLEEISKAGRQQPHSTAHF